MAAGIAGRELQDLLAQLITREVVYFPIRHHSPACAWHLERLIRERKPCAVLIEGPASFTPLIPLLLHPKTQSPVAIYASFAAEMGTPTRPDIHLGPHRFAAYYPFCDYSPELVALRTGAAVGAELKFIDLDYAGQVQVQLEALTEAGPPRVESLLSERHFKRSEFLRKLAARAGCRDHNDLWDHLFETRLGIPSDKSDQFIRDVAAWCYFARRDSPAKELRADGTLQREAVMAAQVRNVLARGLNVIVVTGGFHTVALPAMVKDDIAPPKPSKPPESTTYLVRYSFEQLDALNGYAAGMPSPFYYDQLWRAAQASPASEPFTDLAAKTLVQMARLTRAKKMANALSPADEIASLEQARRLAALRGHPGPTREDLLDGIRSCFVKGSMDAEGEILLGLARHTLAGNSIGEVPLEAGIPPLVENFRNTAKQLRLNIADSIRRKSSLDLYRKTSDRRCSRFFHSLGFLGVPFATMVAGPDFVRGIGLERLHEHWDYHWSPQTESFLVEASVYGAHVEEAAANRLLRAIAELEEQGRGRNALTAVGMLIHACRMGLHRHTQNLRALIAGQIADDPDFNSLASSLGQLILLWESREPLEAQQIAEIPALIRAAYGRASYLLHDLANATPDAAPRALQSLMVLRDLLHTKVAAEERLDPALLFEPLRPLVENPSAPPLLAGGAAGILYAGNRLDDSGLMAALSGFLNSAAIEPEDQMGFLVGLLRTCRELAWRQPALAETIESLLEAWSDEEFISRLPHLRLAFADLTPQETDHVAGIVAGLHGGEKLGRMLHTEFSEAEMIAALKLNAAVKKSLAHDGLANWIAEVAE